MKWVELGCTVFEFQLVVRSLEMRNFLRSFMRLGILVRCCKEFVTEIRVLVNFVLTYQALFGIIKLKLYAGQTIDFGN